jgi:tetratricopeptide (TPR) repeat protein
MAEEQASAEQSPEQSSGPPTIQPQEQSSPPAGEAEQLSTGAGDVSDEISLPNPLVLSAIGLALLSVITFLPTLRGSAIWLDDVSLTNNPFVLANDGVARFWTSADRAGRYEPMTLTSFWLDVRLFPKSLPAQHLINVILNAVVVILLWTLLRRLEVPGAWFAAAIFAVHPVHAQAIAWLSGRSVVLASVFYLSAMLVYLRFLGLTPAAETKTLLTLPPEPERLWGLAFVLFLCALLSNAGATVTFPIAILLIVWWKHNAITSKQWLGILPFFLAALAGGAWTGWLQESSLATEAMTAAYGYLQFPERFLLGNQAIWFYALKIIAPYPLIFDYPRWESSAGIGSVCGLLILVALGVLLSLRGRFGRGPLAAGLLFIVALVPMLSLLDPPAIRYSFVADYRQYLASAALIALIAAAATRIVNAEKLREFLNPSYCAGAVLVVLAVMSFRQGAFYLTSQSLWKQTIADNKSSLLGDEQYADYLLGIGEFDAADQWYQQAQKLVPHDAPAAVGLGIVAAARAYDEQSMGQGELAATQQTSAKQYLRDAIRLDPDYEPAYVVLARILSLEKDDKAAIDALTQAKRIDPNDLRNRLELGAAQRRVGDLKDAESTLTDLADDDPNNPAVHSELGNIYVQEQRLQDALAEWQKTVQLDPANTTVPLNFGRLLESSGQNDLAAKQYQAASILNPSLIEARLDLARVYTKLGHRHDAVTQLTQAVEMDPNNTAAQAQLAKAVEDEKKNGAGTPATSQPATEAAGGPASPGDGLNVAPGTTAP